MPWPVCEQLQAIYHITIAPGELASKLVRRPDASSDDCFALRCVLLGTIMVNMLESNSVRPRPQR